MRLLRFHGEIESISCLEDSHIAWLPNVPVAEEPEIMSVIEAHNETGS